MIPISGRLYLSSASVFDFCFCRQEAVPNNHVQIDIWGECAEKSSNIITRQDKSSKWLVSEPSSAIHRNLFRVLGISTGLHCLLVIFTIYIHIKLWDPQLDQWPSLSYSHSLHLPATPWGSGTGYYSNRMYVARIYSYVHCPLAINKWLMWSTHYHLSYCSTEILCRANQWTGVVSSRGTDRQTETDTRQPSELPGWTVFAFVTVSRGEQLYSTQL